MTKQIYYYFTWTHGTGEGQMSSSDKETIKKDRIWFKRKGYNVSTIASIKK